MAKKKPRKRMSRAEAKERHAAARAVGIKPASLAKRDYRAKVGAFVLKREMKLEAFWRVPPALAGELSRIRLDQTTARSKIRASRFALEHLRESSKHYAKTHPVGPDWVTKAILALEDLEVFLGEEMIGGACPYCKSLPIDCRRCHGTRGMCMRELAEVSDVYASRAKPMVEVDGKPVPYLAQKNELKGWMDEE